MKRGSVVLYVVFAAILVGLIISYVYTRVANSQIAQLTQFNRMKEVYEQHVGSIEEIL